MGELVLDDAAVLRAKETLELNKNPTGLVEFYNVATAHLILGDMLKALVALQSAHELDPTDIDTLIQIGSVFGNLNKHEEGLKFCDMALEQAPEQLVPRFNRVVFLAALGRFDEAIETCDAGLSFYPDHPDFVKVKQKIKDIIDGAG